MRLFKFIAMFGVLGFATTFAPQAHATLVDYTANTAAEMGAAREVGPTTSYGTNNFTISSAYISATPVESFNAINFGVTIPAGQQIDSATLTLHVMSFGSSAGGTVIGLPVYGLNTDFTASQMTWNNRNTSTAWTTSGAKDGTLDHDASTETITTVTIPSSGNTPFNWDVKDLIQSQYDDGTLGNGILVGGNTASAHGVVSFAGYAGLQGVGTQPTLSITYSVAAVPEPSSFAFGLAILGLGVATKSRKRQREV